MNGSGLFAILMSTVKSRFAMITSRLRMWTSWSYIRSHIFIRIRNFFMKLLDVRPKNKDDYFQVFGWMVSKRLAYAILIIAGVVSLWYILSVRKVFANTGSGSRTYKYNSVMLRFAKDNVKILGKSGYLAYEGQVAKGYASGEGNLYDPAGHMVYRGHFEKSKFEQIGTTFYPTGNTWYTGNFHENLYDGSGKLYREDGSLYYDGEFSMGKMTGTGRLCDAAGNQVYEGAFANDDIVYANFLGKTAADVAKTYSGARKIWQGGDMFCVLMSDINALYAGYTESDSLSDEVTVESIFVLSETFPSGEAQLKSLESLWDVLGEPIYEGNSPVILPEAVTINALNEIRPVFKKSVTMDTESVFSDVTSVESFDDTYPVYLTTFENGGLLYTFVSPANNDSFAFYYITKGEGAA